MTSNATPWVHVGDGPPGEFFDEPHFLRPGDLARWNREQLAIRAEEQRKQAEAQERSDARIERATWEARAYCVARGLPFDPSQPFANTPNIYQRAEAEFRRQDAMARAADFAAAREAGLTHLLHAGVPSTPGEPVQLEPPGPSGSAARNRVPLLGPPDTTSPAGKARAALRRWSARERRQRASEQQQ